MLRAKFSRFIHLNETRLSQRVAHAGFWAFLLDASGQIVSFARVIIIARILAPGDFGLMGIALLCLTFTERLSKTGFFQALVQRQDNIEGYLDTAWTLEIIRGFITATLIFLVADLVASFFGAPEAKPLIQMVALVTLIRGFYNIGIVYLRKELNLRKEFVLKFGQVIVDSIVAITLALVLRNVWALAWGMLGGAATGLLLSYVIYPRLPHLELDFGKAKELFKFGGWIVVTLFAYVLAPQADRAIIGKLLGPVGLGLYMMIGRISNIISSQLIEAVNKVGLPTYSMLQDDLPRLRVAVVRSLEAALVIALPAATALSFLAEDIVTTVLGDQWLESVSALQIFAFVPVARMLLITGSVPFQGIGKPQVGTLINTLSLVTTLILIWPMTVAFGLEGAALAILLGHLLVIPFMVWQWYRLIGLKLASLAKGIAPSVLFSVLIILIVESGSLLFDQRGALFLATVVFTITVSYLGGSLLLWRTNKIGPIRFINMALSSPQPDTGK